MTLAKINLKNNKKYINKMMIWIITKYYASKKNKYNIKILIISKFVTGFNYQKNEPL